MLDFTFILWTALTWNTFLRANFRVRAAGESWDGFQPFDALFVYEKIK